MASIRRWEDAAEAMREALVAHDAALRQAIEMHGGFVFKHTGDGMCAAFASPKGALDGPVLNRTARVMAAGHGGRILVAMSTAVLLAGHEMLVDRQRDRPTRPSSRPIPTPPDRRRSPLPLTRR